MSKDIKINILNVVFKEIKDNKFLEGKEMSKDIKIKCDIK